MRAVLTGVIARARSLWRGVGRRADVEAEMAEEFRLHQAMRAEDLVRGGLTPDAARRQARLEFGCAELHKDDARAARGLHAFDDLRVSWLDVKLGARMVARHPGLTVVAVLALSIAIAGGASYLEFLNDLYHPTLPFPQGERIVGLQSWDPATGEPEDRALHDFVAWRGALRSVELLGAFQRVERNLVTGDGRAEPVRAVAISPVAFRLTAVPPHLGRPLVEADERADAPDVAVIGHALWRARFAADPGVVGRTVRLGGATYTVVGVMPDGFAFPTNDDLWTPLRPRAAGYAITEGPSVRLFGRLAPGASLRDAQAELTAVARRERRRGRPALQPIVRPYPESLLLAQRDGQASMWILYAVNLLLLGVLGVCGANVATLVFARTAARESELTVRAALGAGRGRIVGQLFAEGLVLTGLAALLGVGATALGARWVARAAGEAGLRLPFWWDVRLAPSTLLYVAVLTLVAAVLVGVVPALRATGPALQARLRDAAAGGSRLTFGRLWTGVIVGQVALTVAFLLAMVAIGSNVRAGRYGPPSPRFAAAQFLSARLETDRDSGGLAPATLGALAQRLAAEPGVAGVSFGDRLPGMEQPSLRVEVDGATGVREARTAAVAPGFFAAFDAAVVAGRAFEAADTARGRHVVVVDETFVRQVLGGRDAVGARVRAAADENDATDRGERPWLEIVGVVRDLTVGRATAAGDAMLYRPIVIGAAAPNGNAPLRLVAHVRGRSAAALAPRLRAIASQVDPALRLYDVMPLDRVGSADRLTFDVFVRAVVVLGAIALLLSAAGIYALMAFTVARRTREIAIRAALGAAPRRVVGAVLRRALLQVGLGIAVGSVPGVAVVVWGAPELARGAGGLAGIGAFLVVAGFVATVALLASAVPARRALGVQPTDALRAGG